MGQVGVKNIVNIYNNIFACAFWNNLDLLKELICKFSFFFFLGFDEITIIRAS